MAVGFNLNAQPVQALILSPDKHIALKFMIKEHAVYYSVAYNGQVVIEPSTMGLTINGRDIGTAGTIKVLNKAVINESYPWRGVHSRAVNHCNFALLGFSGTPADTYFSMEAKVFNNGVAFRYILPNGGASEINADLTRFSIPAGSITWAQDDIAYYEGGYKPQIIDEVKVGNLAGPPLTVKLPGNAGFAAITEGGVTDFAGMSLKAEGDRIFKANLTGLTHLNGDIETPWRIIEIGKDLNTLVNCDIVANVSAKPDPALFPKGFATGWVQPGKSAWSWLAGGEGVTFSNMKKYSKLAGELGIAYNLVDDGWGKWNDGGKDKWELIKELVDYSRGQHVKVWVWKAYPDRDNIPGIKDPKARTEFFSQCKKAGVAGIKIDFFDAETQEVLNFYQVALRDAAKMHLMIDFHGADKPTGQSRTWPNEMTREGIRGLEYGASIPKDNATLPFTRFLAGHGDYTPLTFRKDMAKATSLTHQVATVVTFTSPFMCLGVNPEDLLKSPVKEIIRQLPTTWDETVVLPQSEIGELSVFARRKGTTWYVAVLNAGQPRSVRIDLGFLKANGYHATLLQDDPASSEKTMISHKNFSSKDSIRIELQPGGGFVGKFVK